MKNSINNSIVLITGGTGSFGMAVTEVLLNGGVKEVRIFSRDEKKQDELRKKYINDRVSFYIGDVRDKSSLNDAMSNVDYIFHAAALKQVPSCEFFPLEAIKTNVLGTSNVLDVAIENAVKKVICLSTDKSVYPINAMGQSKALMEKVALAKSRTSKNTNICITRYGNVLGSRGSILPVFLDKVNKNLPLTITDYGMTRFIMTLEEAVDLVLYAFESGENGDTLVQKSKSISIENFVNAFKQTLEIQNYPVIKIGVRHGEKKYEALLGEEELLKAIDLGKFFRVPIDSRGLNYEQYVEYGIDGLGEIPSSYNSNNAEKMTLEELTKLLKSELSYE